MSPLSSSTQPFMMRTIVGGVLICLVVAGLLLYTGWQARFLLAGPQVTFTNELPFTQAERVVYLEGNAENIVRMTLNGRQIYTDETGHFREMVVLENGYTTATIEAHDRYGRTVQTSQAFVYEPAVTPEPSIEIAQTETDVVTQ
jgi:hypothetical protein